MVLINETVRDRHTPQHISQQEVGRPDPPEELYLMAAGLDLPSLR